MGLRNYITRIRSHVHLIPKRKVLPVSYLILVAIGFSLSLVSVFVPFLNMCSSPFGSKICAPFGMYIIVAASFPGYLAIGLLQAYIRVVTIPETLSLILVGVLSVAFYYGVGRFLDRRGTRQVFFQNKIVAIVSISFVTLIALLLYLLLALSPTL